MELSANRFLLLKFKEFKAIPGFLWGVPVKSLPDRDPSRRKKRDGCLGVLPVLLLADPIRRLAHVLYDVETVVDDLVGRARHVFERHLERRSHMSMATALVCSSCSDVSCL